MSRTSSSSGSQRSRKSKISLETSALLMNRPKSYGSLMPYYEFVKASVRQKEVQVFMLFSVRQQFSFTERNMNFK